MFWSSAQQAAQAALVSGSLLPIATEPDIIEENGLSFYLHVINANLKQKLNRTKNAGNPFLPYDQDMFVAQAGDDHVCLLNKFPVLAPHLLICSNTFIEQRTPLQLIDFQAWLLGYSCDDAFGFYNGGATAGASQPHRHMQLIKTAISLEPLILSGQLPFKHKLYRYEQLNAQTLADDYSRGMAELGLYHSEQCQPYNLLLTNGWMLIFPRSANNVNGIFANGMNYSGHFLMRNQTEIDWLKRYGVVRYLTECADGS
ncbi:MAG: ATP adenylyltransferase [Phenylobacterium sp.]|jgi:ATP adenylyltransferase